jgi:superfamily II helicase
MENNLIQVSTRVLRDSKLSLSEKGVYCYLAGGNEVEVISDCRYGMSVPIDKELNKLERLRYIKCLGVETTEKGFDPARFFMKYEILK